MTGRAVHVYTGSAGPFLERVAARLREVDGIDDVVTVPTEAAFEAQIAEVDALVAVSPPRHVWGHAERLRLIHAPGTGVDGLLPAEGLDERVTVVNAAGTAATAIAEFTLATLLSLCKRLPAAGDLQRARTWRPTSSPVTLDGSTITIAGTGPIGRSIAARLVPFGVRLIGVRRRPEPVGPFHEVVGLADLERALSRSIAVVVALPLAVGLEGIFDGPLLRAMPRGAMFVNIARGALVDELALVRCLEDGHLGGAALDVTAIEPLPVGSPLWTAPNLLLTPHVSWRSDDHLDRVVDLIADNLRRHWSGRPLRNVVDRAHGYVVDDTVRR